MRDKVRLDERFLGVDGNVRSGKGPIVRWVLFFAGIGWGISIWFSMSSWDLVVAALVQMGASPISYDPFLYYWVKVVGVIFGMIGLGCLLVAIHLSRYGVFVRPLAVFHLVIALCSIGFAWQMKLSPLEHPTLIAELLFSLTIGVVLLAAGGGSEKNAEASRL